MKRIEEFQGEYRFLSNFYIEPDGTHVEGEYQAAKTWPLDTRLLGMTPGKAKAAGRKAPLRKDWEDIKEAVMLSLVLRKFSDHSELRRQLQATSPAILVEGNTWGDTFWGVCRGEGLNRLGKILMLVRYILANPGATAFMPPREKTR